MAFAPKDICPKTMEKRAEKSGKRLCQGAPPDEGAQGNTGQKPPKVWGPVQKRAIREANSPLKRNTHGKKAETINRTKGNHGLYLIDLQPYLAELWTDDANYRRDMCIYFLSPEETALTGRLNQLRHGN